MRTFLLLGEEYLKLKFIVTYLGQVKLTTKNLECDIYVVYPYGVIFDNLFIANDKDEK